MKVIKFKPDGDTIKEKFESLWLKIQQLNESYRIRTMIFSDTANDIFHIANVIEECPSSIEIGRLRYLGVIKRLPQMKFDVWATEHMSDSNIVMLNESEDMTLEVDWSLEE